MHKKDTLTLSENSALNKRTQNRAGKGGEGEDGEKKKQRRKMFLGFSPKSAVPVDQSVSAPPKNAFENFQYKRLFVKAREKIL